MKYKSINLLFLALAIMFSLCLVSGATGTVSMTSPATGATLTQNFNLNVTNSTFNTMKNCTFVIGSTLTANTSVTIGTITNTSLIMVNTIYNSTFLEDAQNYILTATCRNLTNDIATATATGLIVQNTVPTTPSTLLPSQGTVDTDGLVTFSSTVVGRETTSCTLYFSGQNPGSSSYSMTHTGNTCTSSQLTIPEQGYEYYIQASDGTDTTNSATTSFSVDTKSSAGKTALLASQPGVTATGGATLSVAETVSNGYIPGTGIPIWFVLVLLGIIVAIVLIYKFS